METMASLTPKTNHLRSVGEERKTLFKSLGSRYLTQHLHKRNDISDICTFPLSKAKFLTELRCAVQKRFIAGKATVFSPLDGISLSHVMHSLPPTLQRFKPLTALLGAWTGTPPYVAALYQEFWEGRDVGTGLVANAFVLQWSRPLKLCRSGLRVLRNIRHGGHKAKATTCCFEERRWG